MVTGRKHGDRSPPRGAANGHGFPGRPYRPGIESARVSGREGGADRRTCRTTGGPWYLTGARRRLPLPGRRDAPAPSRPAPESMARQAPSCARGTRGVSLDETLGIGRAMAGIPGPTTSKVCLAASRSRRGDARGGNGRGPGGPRRRAAVPKDRGERTASPSRRGPRSRERPPAGIPEGRAAGRRGRVSVVSPAAGSHEFGARACVTRLRRSRRASASRTRNPETGASSVLSSALLSPFGGSVLGVLEPLLAVSPERGVEE